MICKLFTIDNVLVSEHNISNNDGQQIKTACPNRLLTLMPDLTFTQLDEGLNKTVEWFRLHYPNIRK